MQDLGTITTKQKMTGVLFTAQDANGNQVASFGGMQVSATPAGIVSFSNLAEVDGDSPASSQFKVDITALAVGQATISAQGQQGNFQPHFTTLATIEVTLDPSTPGVPTQFAVAPGTILPQ